MVVRIKVCLNGSREPDEHPALPVTSREIAKAAAAAVAAGAEAVHVHPRDRHGEESLQAEHVSAVVRSVRDLCPTVPIGVSTGLWIADGDNRLRQHLVQRWGDAPASARPDFASVNVGEPGFIELADTLRDAGIGVEAGVWSLADAYVLVAAGYGDKVLRILVEVVGTSSAHAIPMADQILGRLDQDGLRARCLLHGEDEGCWPLVTHAGRLGLPTRIGLEDTLTAPDGTPAGTNADLVRQALIEWERGRHQA